jgi:hypothetical protein
MEKKKNKPQHIPLRAIICEDDRNYDMLVEETISLRNRLTQISIEDSRNGGVVSDVQIRAAKAFQDTLLLMNAIKQEKKILEDWGLKQSKQQSKRASRERSIKNENHQTLDGVIEQLVREHPNEKPSAIWTTHFKTAIKEWGATDSKTGNQDSRSYQFDYQFKDNKELTKGSITFESFRKKLSKFRKELHL